MATIGDRKLKTLPVAGVLVISCLRLGWADDVKPSTQVPKPSAVAAGAPAASLSSPVSTPTAFSISSNTQGSTASLKASLDLPRYFSPTSLMSSSASLTVSTPVSKGSQPTTFASLGGFTNATTGTGEYDLTWFPSLNRKPIIAAIMKCAAAAAKLVNQPDSGVCPDLSGYTPANDDERAEWEQWKSAFTALQADLKSPAQATPAAWVFGINVTGTDDSHTYYNAKSLAKSQFTDVPISGGPSATYVFEGWETAATFQFQYAVTDKDNDSETVCPSGSPPVTCVVGSIGRPKKTTQDTLSFQLRKSLNIGLSQPIGIAPKASYDANSGIYSFSLPIFLFGCGNQLNGGIEYDWSSDVHRSTVGAFISAPFSVFNGLSSGSSSCPASN